MVNHHNGETSPQRWRSHQNGEIGPLRERIGWPQGPHPPKFARNTAKKWFSSHAKPRNSPKYPRRALGSCSLGVWTPVCRVTNSVKWVQKICYGENNARRVPKTVEMWCVEAFLRKTSAQAGRVLGPRSGLACGEVLQAPADPSRFVSPGGSLRAFRALAHSDVHCGLALRASLAPRRRRVSSGLPLAKRLADGLSAAAWRSAAEAGWSGHS